MLLRVIDLRLKLEVTMVRKLFLGDPFGAGKHDCKLGAYKIYFITPI